MAIQAVFALSKDDPEARSWLGFLRQHGSTTLSNLIIERVFWLEGNVSTERLMPLLEIINWCLETYGLPFP